MPPRTADMKKLILFLDRVMTPTLILSYVALCVILLAVSPKVSALLAMLWGGAMMAALRWGIWGILKLAQKTTSDRSALKVLVRTVEVLQVLLIIVSAVISILLWEIPSVMLLVPAAFFGLRGAIRFDAETL